MTERGTRVTIRIPAMAKGANDPVQIADFFGPEHTTKAVAFVLSLIKESDFHSFSPITREV